MDTFLTDEKSIYLQISEIIETDILRGILLADEKVPSTNELTRQYMINPATAARGINLLVAEGILYKKRGVGMFVSPGAREQILEKRQKAFKEHSIPKLLQEAAGIGLSKEEVLRIIENSGGPV